MTCGIKSARRKAWDADFALDAPQRPDFLGLMLYVTIVGLGMFPITSVAHFGIPIAPQT